MSARCPCCHSLTRLDGTGRFFTHRPGVTCRGSGQRSSEIAEREPVALTLSTDELLTLSDATKAELARAMRGIHGEKQGIICSRIALSQHTASRAMRGLMVSENTWRALFGYFEDTTHVRLTDGHVWCGWRPTI